MEILLIAIGFVCGLGVACVLAEIARRHAAAEFERRMSERAGIERLPNESADAFRRRAVETIAERESEIEWGVPRLPNERWDDYVRRVARESFRASSDRRTN